VAITRTTVCATPARPNRRDVACNVSTGAGDNADKYRGKYRIPSARWRDWDYGANAAYFVTICTAHRQLFFGQISDAEMIRSEIGQIAHEYWLQIPEHFPFVVSDQFVIMPNHVHGIIVINKPDHDVQPVSAVTPVRMAAVETLHATSLPCENEFMHSISPKSHSLSAIMRSYKSAVTKYAGMNNIPFAWQTRFHDRVIRNHAEWQRTAEYILTNPQNWKDDEFYSTT
jgi:REP element-mobilizing transposase RayT